MMFPLKKLIRKRPSHRRPRVLICTPEITELPEGMGNAANYVRIKGGGLGDISAGLVRYIHEEGRFDLHVALPKYENKIRDFAKIGFRELDTLSALLHRKGIHLVSDSAFSHLEDVYDDADAHPRILRALAFQRQVINHLLDEVNPDVIHCNDWMTGLIPPAAREKGMKSLFTLHNVFTEGISPQSIDHYGIDVRRFINLLYFESYPEDSLWGWTQNTVDFAASGIHAADLVNTVSPSFLQEMLGGEFQQIVPATLRDSIRKRHAEGSVLSVLNAPNDSVDPRVGRFIIPYDSEDVVEKKAANKSDLQKRIALRHDPGAPLFFWPSRLYPQKGPELLCDIARHCADNKGMQIAVVANGGADFVRQLQSLEQQCPGTIAYHAFDEELSEMGKAGSDFILMPSLYEPCGLPQMEGPRYGTLPVARCTGGIKDTVCELIAQADTGNGFLFAEHTSAALEMAIDRALVFYRLPQEVKIRNLRRIMRESIKRFNLANTANQYVGLYERLIETR